MPTDLRSELRSRAERSAQSIMAEAHAEAERLTAETERQIEERRRTVLGKQDRELRSEAHAKLAAERHAAMRAVLLAKARVIERVLEGARARLPEAVRSNAYTSRLGRELTNAIAFVGEQGAVVRCSGGLRPAVLEAIRELPNVTVESESDADSGFRVVSTSGSVVVDATLETRLERLASSLAIEIHERLQER